MPSHRDRRIAFYLEQLADGPLPAQALHQRLDIHLADLRCEPVALRTVQTDLADLRRQLGTDVLQRVPASALAADPPAALAQHRWFYRLDGGLAIRVLPQPLTSVSELELLAIEVARDLLDGGGGAVEHPLGIALDRLLDRLGLADEALPNSIGVAFAPRQPFAAEHLTTLLRAIRLGESVSMRYQPVGRAVQAYELHPVQLWFSDGEPYCWAWDPAAATLKNFKLSRVEAVRTRTVAFDVPSGLRGEAAVQTQRSFRGTSSDDQRGRVVVRFDPTAVPFIVGRRFGQAQTWEELEDGWVRVAFNTSGMGGVWHWALGFGSHAVVEAPAEIREWIRSECVRIQARYGEVPSEREQESNHEY